jgi:hypothetical protein
MTRNLVGKIFPIALAASVLLIGASFWYYTLGRKPKLVLSKPIGTKTGTPISHRTGPGEVLLLVGNKATLFDTVQGKEKWASDLTPAAPAAPRATPTPADYPKLTSASDEKKDPSRQILVARIARRSAKLQAWAAELHSKRGKLDTALKAASFNEEEAKYHAEMAEARAEKATLRDSADTAFLPQDEISFAEESAFGSYHGEIFSNSSAIWIAQGANVRMLDRANGRLLKELPLGGQFEKVMRGADCWYVTATNEAGARQIMRIPVSDGMAKLISVAGSSADSHVAWQGNEPALQAQRTEFSATGAELAQLEVRLLEKKITEKQALKGDSASDWQAAEEKTTSGWAMDAGALAQAIANDAQRELTGGKERIDESTYEVILRRPFKTDLSASAPEKVQGRPKVFSTASLDLVVAGRTLLAFDHQNKKLWTSTLGFPTADVFMTEQPASDTVATLSRPCLEDGKRLYFFDKGFLSAFDRNSGATLWRLPSVGIQKVQLDGGALYVTSSNSSAQSLQYTQQADVATPLLYKIDASSGKIFWKQEKYDDCFVSEGSVYATLETRNAADLVNSVFQRESAISTRFKLYKLSASDGKPQWEWFQTRRPVRIEADKRKVTLLFADELQILKSIAL